MDELLHSAKTGKPAPRSAADTLTSAGRTLALVGKRILSFFTEILPCYLDKFHTVAQRHPISPLMFLVFALSIGFAATVLHLYDESYVVTVDGVDVGVVHEIADFERSVKSVEARATRMLGEEYTIDSVFTFTKALSTKEDFTSARVIETYLFNNIENLTSTAVAVPLSASSKSLSDLIKGYDLVLEGQVICSADDRETLEELLDSVAAPYVTPDTVAVSFEKNISIVPSYVTSESNIDLSAAYALLTENTTGETTYTVVSGDTYSEIAMDNDMSLDELMELNPQASLKSLFVGDVLNVKRVIPYLSVITTREEIYEETIESPIEYVDDNTIYQGNTKVISQGTDGLARVYANVTYVNGYESDRSVHSSETLVEPTVTVMARGTLPRPKTASNGYYIWPCKGTISSRYGWRTIFGSRSFHGGLDIANSYGTTIVAADGGLVTYSGWNSGGYGYLVVIKHDDGSETYYGHNSSLLVSKGVRVYQGQAIAKMGSTGRSTGNHCHFEVRINGNRVNPANYLS